MFVAKWKAPFKATMGKGLPFLSNFDSDNDNKEVKMVLCEDMKNGINISCMVNLQPAGQLWPAGSLDQTREESFMSSM